MTFRQRLQPAEPFYFPFLRFPTHRPEDPPARYVVTEELTRNNAAVEKVSKVEVNGKTLYRLHLNVRENEEVYFDVDPDMNWAIVKLYTKGTNSPECEYTIDLVKMANGKPFLKRFHTRQKDKGKEWRDVSTTEYTLQEGTKFDPAEYTLAFYGLAEEKKGWDMWTIGLIAWGGLTVLLVLFYLVTKRRKPATQAATA
jgi:hypothetical protein